MSSAMFGSMIRELRSLVRLYRGESVFPESGASDEPQTAVLLGTQVLSGGRPSEPLRARSWHAARLYARGEVGSVIATGGVGKRPPSEAEVAARLLLKAGVPEEVVLLETEAGSTRESAQLVAAMVRVRGIRSLMIVTDPLHCVRAVGAFRAEGLSVRASPAYGSPMWKELRLRRGQFLREMVAILWYEARKSRRGPRFWP